MSETSDIIALATSFVCLAAWINLFKFANRRWRFEFFTIDFAVGALLLSAVAAFTLGNFESDLSLGDRLLIASKTSQALAFLAGCLLGLGLMSLFGAVRLIGASSSSTIAFSLAALISSSVTLTSNNILFSAVSLALLFAAMLLGAKAARGLDAPLPPAKNARQPVPLRLRQSSKGILLALAAGLFLGGALPILFSGVGGDFGLGPYAGVLVASVGALPAAALFSLFLLHIKIDLPPSTLRGYWSGSPKSQHHFGLIGGVLCAAGSVAYLVVHTNSLVGAGTSLTSINLVAAAGLTLSVLSGFALWKEKALTKSAAALLLGILLFAGGVFSHALAGHF